MAAKGVNIKALDTLPKMLTIDSFYKDMYVNCQNDFIKIEKYCSLYGLSNEDTIEAIAMMHLIRSKVK